MVSQEQDVRTDYDCDHREHIKHDRYLSSHCFVLLCEALSSKQCALTGLFTRRQPLRSRSFRRVGATLARCWLATVSAVTDSTWLDTRREDSGEQPRGARRRQGYLPSAQVVHELASLGPDLGKLADELRQRLSDPAD